MDITFYKNLQTDFIYIRRLITDGCYDEVLFNKTIENIKLAKATLITQKQTIDTRILLYCIDTLFEIINENNKEKLYDFTDTIHNIPEIAFTKRQFKSFRREIKAFRKKYGREYFADFNDILTNGIITPLSVGVFNLISPVPIFLLTTILNWIITFNIGMDLLGYEPRDQWFSAIFSVLSLLISPTLSIAGIIYGIVKRKEKYGKLCIVLSAISLIATVVALSYFMYFAAHF